MKRKWLTLLALQLAVSACEQAPNDDPPGVGTTRVKEADRVRQSQQSRAKADPYGQRSFAGTYELQGALGAPRSFESRERCERARRALSDEDAKADREQSERGAMPPNRPFLACVLI